jgi:hypoxanthine phosphoribosyltransferase
MEIYGRTFEKYLGQKEISQMVSNLAKEIDKVYLGKDFIIVGVLNGAFPFLSDLIPQLKSRYQVHFTKYSSYVGTDSTGVIRQDLEVDAEIKDRHVLVIEDIVDTGNTLVQILSDLAHHHPASLKVCSLLLKPEIFDKSISVDFVGKEIPNHFVIGYGMDIDGEGRELSDIYRLME